MLEQVKEVPGTVGKGINTATETAHKAVQASLGAAVMVQEEVTGRFSAAEEQAAETKEEIEVTVEDVTEESKSRLNEFIERGDQVQQEMMETVHGWVDPQIERVENMVQEFTTRVEDQFQKGVEGFLVRANIPTKTDIQDLNKKVGSLGRKVDRLRRAQEAALKKDA